MSARRPGAATTSGALELSAAAAQPVEDVLQALNSGRGGLSSIEAAQRLTVCGRNVLAEHRVTVRGVLARQLRNPLLILLAGAAVVSGATGDSRMR